MCLWLRFLRSEEVGKNQSTRVQKFTKMQKKIELLYADCVQWFQIFSARFDCLYVHFGIFSFAFVCSVIASD